MNQPDHQRTWTVAKAQPQSRQLMGQWLLKNMPRGIDLELPSRDEPEHEIPFISANRTVPTGLSHTRAHSP